VGEQHARAFAADARCRLRWVFDLEAPRMQRVVQAIGQGAAADSYEQVLADPGVDIVALATYDNLHAEAVVSALQAGKHVFCEKPLCETAEELSAIQQAWRRAKNLRLACNLVLRAAPLYRWLRGAIEGGTLGEIYAVDGDYLYGRVHKITEGWRGQIDGYSVFKGGAVHMLDLMLWLTGQRPTSVSAVGNRIATAGSSFRYKDFVAATYLFPSGLVGRITANFGCVHRHQHTLRVFGTRATFLYDDQGARLHRTRDPAEPAWPLEQSPLPASKGDLIPGFVDRILAGQDGGGEAPGTAHEFDLMAACIAADQAVNSNEPQRIEYLP
jgi:predicted dehydrogenase